MWQSRGRMDLRSKNRACRGNQGRTVNPAHYVRARRLERSIREWRDRLVCAAELFNFHPFQLLLAPRGCNFPAESLARLADGTLAGSSEKWIKLASFHGEEWMPCSVRDSRATDGTRLQGVLKICRSLSRRIKAQVRRERFCQKSGLNGESICFFIRAEIIRGWINIWLLALFNFRWFYMISRDRFERAWTIWKRGNG